MAEREGEISLKVMRLSKPSLSVKKDIHLNNFSGDVSEFESLMFPALVDSSLQLPSSFGNIHMGEYLNCLFVLGNNSAFNLFQVSMKIELQTPTQRFTLHDSNPTPLYKLEPKKFQSNVVKQEIKESGIHVMVCSIHYKNSDDDIEKKFARKLYKFVVINPLSVKTKITSYPGKATVFLEAQIQNLSSDTFVLSKVKFEPTEYFECIDLNLVEHSAGGFSSFVFSESGSMNLYGQQAESVFGNSEFKPDETRQYLFQLSPRNPEQSKKITSLGKLDVVWTSSMGESGRLQTSTLNRKLTNLPSDIEISLISAPPKIVLETPFKLRFRLVSNMESIPRLLLSYSSTSTNVSLINLMTPFSVVHNMEFEYEFIALMPGIQRISGFILHNSDTDIRQELSDTFDIFVYRESE